MTCTSCGSDFQPAVAPSLEPENTGGDQPRKEEPAEPAGVPASTASRERIRVPLAVWSPRVGGKGPRLAAVAFGFFTPLLFLAAMASVAGVTAFSAIVAGPVAIYFLAPKLCEAVLAFGGPEVLRDYVASARVGFLVWTFGPLVAAFYLLQDDDSGAGFVLFAMLGFWLLAAGAAFASWEVASARFWRATSEDEKLKPNPMP